MRARSTLLAAFAAAATVGGCACEKLPPTALTDCRQGAIVQGAVKTDILFVIDNSGSMTQETDNLKANLGYFVDALNGSPIANDVQIGITTVAVQNFPTASYPAGQMVGLQGALVGPITVSGRSVGPILRADSPTLIDRPIPALPALPTGDFPALVDAAFASGATGKEQPLRAMKLALGDPLLSGANSGLLRPGARLAVIFLSDEDDNSETGTNTANSNPRTHNDGGDGVDYKGTVEDPVQGYRDFLAGPIGGEVRDVVVGAIVGVDAVTLAPTCGDTTNSWCCRGTTATTSTCTETQRTSFTQTLPSSTPPNVTSSTLCCGGPNAAPPVGQADNCVAGSGTSCTSPCFTAYDKADRFTAFLGLFPFGKTLAGSVCDPSFRTTLERIAGLIISPTVPLQGEPADPALLVVSIQKTDGSSVACAAGTDYVYAPAAGSKPATVTFLDAGACKLDRGYQIKIDVICAG